MHQIRFRLGLRSRPHWATGAAYSAPQTLYLDFRGPTSKGRKGKGRGEKGKGRGGNEKGQGGRPLPLPNSLRHWVRQALRGVRDSGWPDLAWGFSDLEMTWLLYCAGAASDPTLHYNKAGRSKKDTRTLPSCRWNFGPNYEHTKISPCHAEHHKCQCVINNIVRPTTVADCSSCD